MFWSIKSYIDYQFQAVDKLPDILVDCMANRKINVEYKNTVTYAQLRTRTTFLETAGLGQVVQTVSTFLSAAATCWFVGQLQQAMAYTVEEVAGDSVSTLLENDVVPLRKSSASRFALLLGKCEPAEPL